METHDKLDIPFFLEGEGKHCDLCLVVAMRGLVIITPCHVSHGQGQCEG